MVVIYKADYLLKVMGIGNIIDSETMYEDIIKELSRSERVMVRFYLQLLGVLMMLSNVM